jgi:predicted metal-dependent hydrolase
VTFTSTKLELDWDQDLPVYWFDNSPFKSHFMNSLSTRFHHGEKFFILAVKRYKPEITNLELSKEVDEFILQENNHRQIHNQYDTWLASKGYPTLELQEMFTESIMKVQTTGSKDFNLTMTVCLEHITVIIAEYFFETPAVFDTMHPHFKKLWQWHGIEELEHKSVAADLLKLFGKESVPKRFLQMIITISLMIKILKGTCILLKHDKQLWKWRTLTDAIQFFFSLRNGIFIRTLKSFFRFMKSDFHPSNVDHSHLLKKYTK